MVKTLLAIAGDARDPFLIPGLGRSPGGGNGNPLKYSCLENSMDREVWRATVHRVEKSQTWLSDYHLERLFGGLTVSKALKMCSNFFSSVLALCTNSRN